MIKVVKKGVVPRAQITCPNCHAVLEYGNADLSVDWNRINGICSNPAYYPKSLTCPECGVDMPAPMAHLPKEDDNR